MFDHTLIPIGSQVPAYEGPDNLVNGTFPQVRSSVQIASEETDLKRGAVLGRITEGTQQGKYKQVTVDAKDGSASAECILAEDYQKSTRNQVALAYLSGQFNAKSLILADGLSINTVIQELRRLSIFISPSISRPKI